MKNGIFTLDWASLADALVMAAVAAVLTAFVSLVSTGHFDVFTADWVTVGKNMTNIAFIAAVISLGQNFLSTNGGSVLGVTPNK